MKCNQANELIMKYMDGTLTKEETITLNQHLALCERCKQEFDIFNQMLIGFEVDEIEEVDLGVEFTQSVMEEVYTIGYIKKPTFLRKLVFNISTACVLTILAFLLFTIVFVPDLQVFTNNLQNETIKSFFVSYNSFLVTFENTIANFDFSILYKIFLTAFVSALLYGGFIYFKNFHIYYDLKNIDNN